MVAQLTIGVQWCCNDYAYDDTDAYGEGEYGDGGVVPVDVVGCGCSAVEPLVCMTLWGWVWVWSLWWLMWS